MGPAAASGMLANSTGQTHRKCLHISAFSCKDLLSLWEGSQASRLEDGREGQGWVTPNMHEPDKEQQTFQLSFSLPQTQEWKRNSYCRMSLTFGGCLLHSFRVAIDDWYIIGEGNWFSFHLRLLAAKLGTSPGQMCLTCSLEHSWHSRTFLTVPGTW